MGGLRKTSGAPKVGSYGGTQATPASTVVSLIFGISTF